MSFTNKQQSATAKEDVRSISKWEDGRDFPDWDAFLRYIDKRENKDPKTVYNTNTDDKESKDALTKPEFNVKFFDDASKAWRSNKIKMGAFFKYTEPKKHAADNTICSYVHIKTHKRCSRYTEQFSQLSAAKHRFPTMLSAYHLNEDKASLNLCPQHRNRYKSIGL